MRFWCNYKGLAALAGIGLSLVLVAPVQAQFWEGIRSGLGVQEAGAAAGVGPVKAFAWFKLAGGVKSMSLNNENSSLECYRAMRQEGYSAYATVVVRTAADPLQLTSAVHREVAALRN